MKSKHVLFTLWLSALMLLVTPVLPVTGPINREPTTTSPKNTGPTPSQAQEAIGDGNQHLTRVKFPGNTSYRVIEQPPENPAFVAETPDTLTHFGLAEKFGTIGLMAHNYLAGKTFLELKPGDPVDLVYEEARIDRYRITEVRKFQALVPNSPYSDFLDLQDGTRYSASELFREIYGQNNRLIFQTCLRKGNQSSWGRVFLIGIQIPKEQLVMPFTLNSQASLIQLP